MPLPPMTGFDEEPKVPTLSFTDDVFSHGEDRDLLVAKFEAATGIKFTKDEAENVFHFNSKASIDNVHKMAKIAHRDHADLCVDGQDLVVSFSPSF